MLRCTASQVLQQTVPLQQQAVKKSYSGVPHSEHPSDSVAKIIYKQNFEQHSPMHGVPILVTSGATTIIEAEKVPLWEASF